MAKKAIIKKTEMLRTINPACHRKKGEWGRKGQMAPWRDNIQLTGLSLAYLTSRALQGLTLRATPDGA